MRAFWTGEKIRAAKKILKKTNIDNFQQALLEIEKVVDRPVTADSLGSVFKRENLGAPTSYCRPSEEEQEQAEAQASGSPFSKTVVRLIDLTKGKRGPVSFHELCDKLDLSPSKTKEAIEEARDNGIDIRVENDHVGLSKPEPDNRVHTVGIPPVIGKRQTVGVISDTHLGSKYCLRDQLKDFVHHAYSQGVREILHPGDVLDGCYRHGVWEVSHSGLDDQAQDLFEVLPKLPGLSYHAITGNHDFTFTEANGVSVGPFLTNYFKERGRNDLHFYGDRGAFLKVKGAVVHLWHPRSGGSYARSYPLQKHIERYSSNEKPNAVCAGHWHVYCHVFERGVHALACPTFQGGGSAFSKSLGGAPAIGGMILSWDLTEHGTMRSFIHEYRAYFEIEKRHDINGEDRGIAVNRK